MYNFVLGESTITCCKDCNKRYVGCHCDCDEYKKQKKEYEEIKLKRHVTRYTPHGRRGRKNEI